MFNIKKFIAGFGIIAVFTLMLTPLAHAQSALDAIKSKLQSEGIEVLDYSSPEGEWGSLNNEWIALLKAEGYTDLELLASVYKSYFDGPSSITEKRRELAIAETEKTRLTLQGDIQAKDMEIQAIRNDLESQLTGLENTLVDEVAGYDFEVIGKTKNQASIRELANILVKEIDFYYNYNKWGPLPPRIVGILEQGTTYSSIQDIADFLDPANPESVEEVRTSLLAYEGISADDAELIIDATQIYAAGAAGEAQINQIGEVIARTVQNVAGALAVLWIVIAGIRMIFAQGDENTISEQKKAILYGVIGLIAILLVGRMVDVLYGAPGVNRTELTPDEGFNAEVYGIVSFIKAVIGIVAILFIIVSGVRTIVAAGDEAQVTNQRKSLIWIGVGLILLAINRVIIENLFIQPTQEQSDQLRSSNIGNIINTFSNVLKFVLGFVGLIMLAILVYGAATMIMNYGDSETVEKSKKIITNAIVGIVIILSAYVIVASLVVFG